MKRVLVLGAAGRVGREVARAALADGHAVSVLVRTPAALPVDVRTAALLHEGDIAAIARADLAALIADSDVLVNCAGNSNDGAPFVRLVDHVVAAAEAAAGDHRVCWFFAGAGALDLARSGRKLVDLPLVPSKYRAHLQNYERLRKTALDWRLLCPGPMAHGKGVGLARLRVTVDALPVVFPAWTDSAPAALSLPFAAAALPQLTVAYADAAAVILAHVDPGGWMSRRRVGLASSA